MAEHRRHGSQGVVGPTAPIRGQEGLEVGRIAEWEGEDAEVVPLR